MNIEALQRIEPFLISLKACCRRLASNEWDAEDLEQETLIKLSHSLQQSPDRLLSKAYIQRIAANTWIDQCRKKQAHGSQTLFDESVHQSISPRIDDMNVRELFEQLAHRLNARQMVLILMTDIFQFPAAETAKLLHTTLGAVKEGLKRARQRLKLLAEQEHVEGENSVQQYVQKRASEAGNQAALQTLSTEMFEQFLSGFRSGDPQAICSSYLSLASHGYQVEKISVSTASLQFTFRDPNGHLISITQNN